MDGLKFIPSHVVSEKCRNVKKTGLLRKNFTFCVFKSVLQLRVIVNKLTSVEIKNTRKQGIFLVSGAGIIITFVHFSLLVEAGLTIK